MNVIFLDDHGHPRVLWGCAVNSGSPRVAEVAARVGFDTVWIEMEHVSVDLAAAEGMCMATEAGGGIPLVRTIGYERQQILHALEIGGRIIVVPLVNDAETVRQIVRYGKFRPLGERGYNSRSRAVKYGLTPLDMAHKNASTYLFPQIETAEAVRNLDSILAVEGIAGIFIGPGDLSADLGRPAQFSDPELLKMITTTIKETRAAGLHAGILAVDEPLLSRALEAGADLCVMASDFGAMIQVWRDQLVKVRNISGTP